MAGAVVMAAHKAKAAITQYEVTWVSDASGNVNGSTFEIKQGTILAVEFIPGPGALAPDTLYDVDLLDDNSISLFDDGAGTSVGVNLSATEASHKVPLVGQVGITVYRRWQHGGHVELQVAGAGADNAGTVNIYVLDTVT